MNRHGTSRAHVGRTGSPNSKRCKVENRQHLFAQRSVKLGVVPHVSEKSNTFLAFSKWVGAALHDVEPGSEGAPDNIRW